MFGDRRPAAVARLAIVAAAAVIAAACTSSNAAQPGSSAGAKISGGTVTYGLEPNVTISYIWPFMSIATSSVYNSNQFQYLMYRPLYLFGGNSSTSVSVDYSLGPADAPVYSPDGKTVTITMKGWKWSDGEPVDARDVVFWLNMLEAEKANWYGYHPGLLPDNLVSYSATGPDLLTITMNKGYSSLWFTYNELAQITPFPMAWDVTSAAAAPGSGGCSTDSAADRWAKCKAVYAFLAAQAKDVAGYMSSPLWSVVDGPFKLSYFNSDGNVTVAANPKYSGSPKPVIAALKYVPYPPAATTSTQAKAAGVDIGTVPQNYLPSKSPSAPLPASNPLGSGYYLTPFYPFGINFIQPNFNGPARALVRQLYVRQALQELVDQPRMVSEIWHGYAFPTSGPVPNEPASQWRPSAESANGGQGTYPFSLSGARALLTSHGWSEVRGVMTCQNTSACGAGIAKGTQMRFTMDFSTGTTEFDNEMAVYQSDAAQIGVRINPIGQSFNTVIGESTPCTPGPACNWDALMYGGWVFNGPGYEPTGEPLFATGSGSNSGSYSSAEEDSLINATHTSSSLPQFQQYVSYTMQQAPYIWIPNAYYIQGVYTKLKNVAFNPLYGLYPEFWNFTT
jgi:peptide/nickel transport system substrate-binding protein